MKGGEVREGEESGEGLSPGSLGDKSHCV